jgi:hypothetical protein
MFDIKPEHIVWYIILIKACINLSHVLLVQIVCFRNGKRVAKGDDGLLTKNDGMIEEKLTPSALMISNREKLGKRWPTSVQGQCVRHIMRCRAKKNKKIENARLCHPVGPGATSNFGGKSRGDIISITLSIELEPKYILKKLKKNSSTVPYLIRDHTRLFNIDPHLGSIEPDHANRSATLVGFDERNRAV